MLNALAATLSQHVIFFCLTLMHCPPLRLFPEMAGARRDYIEFDPP